MAPSGPISLGSALAACAFVLAASAAPPLQVVTQSAVLTDLARNVAGPAAVVTTWDSDRQQIVQADLVVGSSLESDRSLKSEIAASGTRARVVWASSRLSGPDPYWWNSPTAAGRVVQLIALELGRIRPEESSAFRHRAGQYLQKLGGLDMWTRTQVVLIPRPSRRILIIGGDPFGWFARDYGFVIDCAGDGGGAADLVQRDGIRAIFADESVSPQAVASLCRQTGAKAGGVLYNRGLSAQGEGSTYLGMFVHNVTTIVSALR